MFWNRKPKCPITEEDREYIEGWYGALIKDYGLDHFNSINTVTPNKDFYNIDFSGIEQDAIDVLTRTKQLMWIEEDNIRIEFFSDDITESSDGEILSTPAAGVDGKWNGAAGTYQDKDDEIVISFERSQLKKPISLIATAAHELTHFILIKENNDDIDDEILTDLTTIFYGYGIFLGNSRFEFSSFNGLSKSGWQSRSQGYLPEPVIAYATAYLSFKRKENTDYKKFFNKTMLSFFNKSVKYLESIN